MENYNDSSKNTNFPTLRTQRNFLATRLHMRTYIVGFIASILLTLLAYFFVVFQPSVLSNRVVAGVIIWCAIIQAIVQLVFFLHLGTGEKPQYKIAMFVIMLILLVIIVGGSMWAMFNMNYLMRPQENSMVAPPTMLQMNGFTLPKEQ